MPKPRPMRYRIMKATICHGGVKSTNKYHMEFAPNDHPADRELKLQVIKIYNAKLAERDARKRFVIDRGLVDVKKQQQSWTHHWYRKSPDYLAQAWRMVAMFTPFSSICSLMRDSKT